jgi:hypothetical protein
MEQCSLPPPVFASRNTSSASAIGSVADFQHSQRGKRARRGWDREAGGIEALCAPIPPTILPFWEGPAPNLCLATLRRTR